MAKLAKSKGGIGEIERRKWRNRNRLVKVSKSDDARVEIDRESVRGGLFLLGLLFQCSYLLRESHDGSLHILPLLHLGLEGDTEEA